MVFRSNTDGLWQELVQRAQTRPVRLDAQAGGPEK